MIHRLPMPEQSRGAALPPRKAMGLAVLRLWDRMAMYMPLLLMLALALGTYWLVRNTSGPTAPPTAGEVRHEVDYFMKNFTLKSFDEAGKLKAKLMAAKPGISRILTFWKSIRCVFAALICKACW